MTELIKNRQLTLNMTQCFFKQKVWLKLWQKWEFIFKNKIKTKKIKNRH